MIIRKQILYTRPIVMVLEDNNTTFKNNMETLNMERSAHPKNFCIATASR